MLTIHLRSSKKFIIRLEGNTMNKLSTAKRVQIIGMLVEGNSIRDDTRMSGCSINTVTKLVRMHLDTGTACAHYQDVTLRNLPKCNRLQRDAIWSFCYAKEKNEEIADLLKT